MIIILVISYLFCTASACPKGLPDTLFQSVDILMQKQDYYYWTQASFDDDNSSNPVIGYSINSNSLEMFDPESNVRMIEYFQYKLVKESFSEFDYSKQLIDETIIEYYKFLQLVRNGLLNKKEQKKPNYVPSRIVDLVWHWHILYTFEYKKMCDKYFNGIFVHHRPHTGNEIHPKNTLNKYQATLNAYEKYFGYKPPSHIWSNIVKIGVSSPTQPPCSSEQKDE